MLYYEGRDHHIRGFRCDTGHIANEYSTSYPFCQLLRGYCDITPGLPTVEYSIPKVVGADTKLNWPQSAQYARRPGTHFEQVASPELYFRSSMLSLCADKRLFSLLRLRAQANIDPETYKSSYILYNTGH